jgi:hypothetical protein
MIYVKKDIKSLLVGTKFKGGGRKMKLIGKVILSFCIILFSFSVSKAEIAVYDANNQFIGYLLGESSGVALQVYVPSLSRTANLTYSNLDKKLVSKDVIDFYYFGYGCAGTPYAFFANYNNVGFACFYKIYYNSGKYYIIDYTNPTDRTMNSMSYGSDGSCDSFIDGAEIIPSLPAREVSLPFTLPLAQPLHFKTETPRGDETFQWPVDPNNTSNGHYGPCSDSAEGCYWLGDSEDTNNVWRDAQPFQLYWWGNKGYHLGADYNLGNGAYDKGKLVYPVTNGIISKVKSNQCGYGNIIFVRHNTSFGVYTSMYAHVDWLEGVPLQEGSSVTMDKPIAKVGNGYWNNPNCSNQIGQWPYHLHFEIREGDNTANGLSYIKYKVEKGPQGQIDPNAFISSHN